MICNILAMHCKQCNVCPCVCPWQIVCRLDMYSWHCDILAPWNYGSLLQKEPYERDNILQKRHIILRSVLIVATPYNTYLGGTEIVILTWRVIRCSVERFRCIDFVPYICRRVETSFLTPLFNSLRDTCVSQRIATHSVHPATHSVHPLGVHRHVSL